MGGGGGGGSGPPLSYMKNEYAYCDLCSILHVTVLGFARLHIVLAKRGLYMFRAKQEFAQSRNPYFGAQSKDCAPYSRIAHMICSHARAQSWNTVSEIWTSKSLRSSAKILLWMVTTKEAKRSPELKVRTLSLVRMAPHYSV